MAFPRKILTNPDFLFYWARNHLCLFPKTIMVHCGHLSYELHSALLFYPELQKDGTARTGVPKTIYHPYHPAPPHPKVPKKMLLLNLWISGNDSELTCRRKSIVWQTAFFTHFLTSQLSRKIGLLLLIQIPLFCPKLTSILPSCHAAI